MRDGNKFGSKLCLFAAAKIKSSIIVRQSVLFAADSMLQFEEHAFD